MSNRNPYGANFVNYMLTKEQVFIQFRSCYYLLYQCLVPNTREALSLLVQHYSVPKDFERSILSGENPRVCNQGILNYLLIVLRRDKDFVKFWKVVKTMVKEPVLRSTVEEIQRGTGIYHPSTISKQSIIHHHDTTINNDSVFPFDQRALSATGDYCVSSCTRPSRTSDTISSKSHYSVLVKSMPDEYMNTVSQLECYLTGDHIGSILECRDVFTANRKILDCLIEEINTKEGLLDFCNLLSTITGVPALTTALQEFYKDVIAAVEPDGSNSSAANNFSIKAFIHSTKSPPGVVSISSAYELSDVFIHAELNQFGAKGVATLKKHYNNLLMSLPGDHMTTLQRFYDIDMYKMSDDVVNKVVSSDSLWSNKRIFNGLISSTKNDNQLLGLSFLVERLATGDLLICDCPNIESFRNDCLQVIMEKGSKLAPTINVSATTSISATKANTATTTVATTAAIESTCVTSVSNQSAIDPPITNMKLLYKLVIPKISAHWDVVLANLEYDLAFKQELDRKYRGNPRECCTDLLEDWISSDRGISPKTFTKLMEVLCTINDIAPFMRDVIDGLKKEGIAIGNHVTPPVPLISTAATELRFQPPPTCPANYVPRLELLKEISSAILNSDITPTIDTTVTIRGIGGIGKSTIAKALCHDPLIKEHFVNGFLWISLTPPLPNTMIMLSEIYQRLTGKYAAVNVSNLENEIKLLVCNPSCKLLVILDDVWEAKDAMVFVDVFSNCKTILTTRKMNINVKIPPKMCFDIEPMTIDEAVKLLTLQMVKMETLHATDVRRFEELAKDLHCWPLLLNLVHGQLYFHCVEWHESPQDAILKVQDKLFEKGLTAFDPEDQLEVSRDNAIKASITASLELLAKNEATILFSIASSIVGFGIYTIKDVLSAGLQMDPKQFDKHTRNLWCHGLINFEDVTFPSVSTKIPCIGIHEVIAHYINENMPDEFYYSTFEVAQVFSDLFYKKYFNTDVASNVGQLFLSQADAIKIPFYIRLFTICAKCDQVHYFNILHGLIEQNIQLLQNDDFICNSQLPSLKNMHKTIEQDCRTIHSLLADGKYNEAITWAKQYFDNHSWKLTLKTIVINLNIMLDSYENSVIQMFIKNKISHFNEQLLIHFSVFRRATILLIIGYNHVLSLVNAAASDVDVKHYLKCSLLDI